MRIKYFAEIEVEIEAYYQPEEKDTNTRAGWEFEGVYLSIGENKEVEISGAFSIKDLQMLYGSAIEGVRA